MRFGERYRMKSSAPSFLFACLVMSLSSYAQQVPHCLPLPPSEKKVVCNSFSLREFPTGFPNDTQTVYVQFTQLSSLGSEALQGLPNLQGLHLTDNRLKTLPGGLFRNLPQLHTLDLSRNLLKDLPPQIFTQAISLAYLSLSENQLAELDPSWFETVEDLKILRLDHNKLKEIPGSVFQKLTMLLSLDLSSNLLHCLSPKSFKGLPYLNVLNLKNNPIRSIAPKTFHGNSGLWVLSLRNCGLTHVPAGLFQPLNHLGRLDLSANEITALEPLLLNVSSELTLDLSGNPWACDCRMQALLNWVQGGDVDLFSKDDVVCAFPKSLKGQVATSLNGTKLCPC
ncbi:phospholipase A2 inhibitor-like [Crotalus adamanteus]|uniref:Phospholipase A2 inhibitor-like n=1 Tax=Crotalus adamanteus TaxID=8729 RepID=A0AAW1C420_CROAD